MAGAMSTAELGPSLAEIIREEKVHAISCTGANLEEDIFNLVAHDYYLRLPHYRELSAGERRSFFDRERFLNEDRDGAGLPAPLRQRACGSDSYIPCCKRSGHCQDPSRRHGGQTWCRPRPCRSGRARLRRPNSNLASVNSHARALLHSHLLHHSQ